VEAGGGAARHTRACRAFADREKARHTLSSCRLVIAAVVQQLGYNAADLPYAAVRLHTAGQIMRSHVPGRPLLLEVGHAFSLTMKAVV
jgi:hypothetical protein